MAITLEKIWDLSNAVLFDIDAPGFNAYARLNSFGYEFENIPGYISSEVMRKYADAEVEEISWCNLGIAVRFYKGDEDE